MKSKSLISRYSYKTYLLSGIILIASTIILWLLLSSKTPEQPIAFRHDIHARDNQIPCLYCHPNARLSSVAGIPSVKKCMVCHMFYAQDNEGITILKEKWKKKEGIEWIRIHSLPDYVYFSHKRHVNEGVPCEDCHGPVREMEVMTRYSTLEMGWCLDCHKERNASTDCLTCHK